jgi:hypothetical protein
MLRGSLPNYTITALENTTSPQYKAFLWITSVEVPSWTEFEHLVRMTQRFALATLFYATNGGSSWLNKIGWLDPSLSECSWYGCICTGEVENPHSVNLSSNVLSGTLPREISLLTDLEEFILKNNQIDGAIPTDLGLLTKLEKLNLESNGLTGPIPTELGLLTNLTLLSLAVNALTDHIPTELGGLTNLSELYLNDNQLTGTIPTEFGMLTSLGYLDLFAVQLNGSVPTELCALVSNGLYMMIDCLEVKCDSSCGCKCYVDS